mmetsp:Transcript_139618/g.445568  ORF Transcript_139618/g.445568 Transcript_139618/m.445568 type:complete len:244 (-) Transcript_139618:32-763(-)
MLRVGGCPWWNFSIGTLFVVSRRLTSRLPADGGPGVRQHPPTQDALGLLRVLARRRHRHAAAHSATTATTATTAHHGHCAHQVHLLHHRHLLHHHHLRVHHATHASHHATTAHATAAAHAWHHAAHHHAAHLRRPAAGGGSTAAGAAAAHATAAAHAGARARGPAGGGRGRRLPSSWASAPVPAPGLALEGIDLLLQGGGGLLQHVPQGAIVVVGHRAPPLAAASAPLRLFPMPTLGARETES